MTDLFSGEVRWKGAIRGSEHRRLTVIGSIVLEESQLRKGSRDIQLNQLYVGTGRLT